MLGLLSKACQAYTGAQMALKHGGVSWQTGTRLKNLPIIPSQNFCQLFPFYSVVSMIISQSRRWLYIPTAVIEYLNVLLEYLDFCKLRRWKGTASIWKGLPSPGVSLATSLFETNVSHNSHVSTILGSVLCLCMANNS